MNSLFQQFENITNNQAYKIAFKDLWMKQDIKHPEKFIGNSQREDFLTYLTPLVESLPLDGHVFDFGAGAGEIVDILLHKLNSATLHIEEPNKILMEVYLKRLNKYSHLKKGHVSVQELQNLVINQEFNRELGSKIDLILGLHMIYHLDDFSKINQNIENGLSSSLSYMYNLLKVGGKIFIVYADQEVSTTGLAAQYYFKQLKMEETQQQLYSIWSLRNKLLKEGRISSILNKKFPNYKALVTSKSLPSKIFADELSELAAMCLTGELGVADNKPFNIDKLHHSLEFINKESNKIGLSFKENTVAQRPMYTANQPQVVTIIEKLKS